MSIENNSHDILRTSDTRNSYKRSSISGTTPKCKITHKVFKQMIYDIPRTILL